MALFDPTPEHGELYHRSVRFVQENGAPTLVNGRDGKEFLPSARLDSLYDLTLNRDALTIRRCTHPWSLVAAFTANGKPVAVDEIAAQSVLKQLRQIQILMDLSEI